MQNVQNLNTIQIYFTFSIQQININKFIIKKNRPVALFRILCKSSIKLNFAKNKTETI